MIERMYVDNGPQTSTWEPVTEEEFIRRTEWAGYWKEGTALQVLKDRAASGASFRTPWAFYRIAPVRDREAGRQPPVGMSERDR